MDKLPVEILDDIFSRWSHKKDIIRNLRLVCHRFNTAASAYLVTDVYLRLSSASLTRFEELCSHPIFRKSVNKVTVFTSYYDPKLAEDRHLFAEQCGTKLNYNLEIMERMNMCHYITRSRKKSGGGGGDDVDTNDDDDDEEKVMKRLWPIGNTLCKIDQDDFDEASASPYQKLVMRLHEMYKVRCSDQETVRGNNRHVTRICNAMKNLSGLTELYLNDTWYTRPNDAYVPIADVKDLGINQKDLECFNFALQASLWCGSYTTAYLTEPPVEMLGRLCSELGQSNIRPDTIHINMHAPADLRCLLLKPDQQIGIKMLVSKATDLALTVDGWARKGSLAENNDRPRDEMLALCSFTQCFYATSTLRNLSIDFREYPRFFEVPQVSLAQILPTKKQAWPSLECVSLRFQPSTIIDMRDFVRSHGSKIETFHWNSPYLLSGNWKDMVNELRGLESVSDVSLQYPKGDPYGDRDGLPDFPYEEVYAYILKRQVKNPL